MSKSQIPKEEILQYVKEIINSPKYRGIDIPEDLIESLYQQEEPHHKRTQDLHKAVRKKLHNIVAPYLGDPDYKQAAIDLTNAYNLNEEAVKTVCTDILNSHASTKERHPFLERFYQEIFLRIGKPQSILDLACGLHPFGLPWMELDQQCQYYAFDIVKERIDLINTFFTLSNRQPLAIQQDILLHPPQIKADVAFFFKEAHRFEQRQRGCNRNFWQALPVKHLLVSLPTTSMSLRHDKVDQHRRLVYENLQGLEWTVEEFQVENELIFWVQKDL
jgi:16S rRNA (guanine(1405)-N(7))-methyltransferase